MIDERDRMLREAYEALTVVRNFAHPGLWDDRMTRLYGELEGHLNESPTGSIREPRATSNDIGAMPVT